MTCRRSLLLCEKRVIFFSKNAKETFQTSCLYSTVRRTINVHIYTPERGLRDEEIPYLCDEANGCSNER